MKRTVKNFVFGVLVAAGIGTGVRLQAFSMDCFMQACSCVYDARSCEYCNFSPGPPCTTETVQCASFTFNCGA